MTYPARIAREQTGLSLADAAKKVGRCAAYLRKIELHGRAPLYVSERLAALYARHGVQCSAEIFLNPPCLGVIETPSATGQDAGGSTAPRSTRRYQTHLQLVK